MSTIELLAWAGTIISGCYLAVGYFPKKITNNNITKKNILENDDDDDDGIKQLYSMDLEDTMTVTNSFYDH